MTRIHVIQILGVFALPALAQSLPDRQAELPSSEKKADQVYLKPRPLSTIAEGEFGNKVRLGYRLFVNSQQMRDQYVGNQLNCVNCHMDAGRKANAAPLWAAYFAYPAYRKKNDKVNSFEERLQGCFTYSMNGTPPPAGSTELVALSAYAYWLGMSAMMEHTGLSGPVLEISDQHLLQGGKQQDFPIAAEVASQFNLEQRASLAGRGYPALPAPEQPYSPKRGQQVYQDHCQSCHNQQGQGYLAGDAPVLPPLWGPQSFNWGAGMHRVNTAAYFIYENMPLGMSIKLTQQQAWDVAAYITSQQRPEDPRRNGSVEQLRKRYHNHQGYYGREP